MAAATGNSDLLYALIGVAVIFGAATLGLATRGSRKQMNALGVWGILTFTYKESIRTKWVLIFGVIFFLLAVDIPDLYLSAAGNLPPEYLTQNLSDLLSVTFPLIPLLALPMGAVSIVDERESGTPPVPALQPGDERGVLPGEVGRPAPGDDHRDNNRLRGGLDRGLHDRHLQLLLGDYDNGLRGDAQRRNAGNRADNLRVLEEEGDGDGRRDNGVVPASPWYPASTSWSSP